MASAEIVKHDAGAVAPFRILQNSEETMALREAVADNLGDGTIRALDLPRIKMPSQAGRSFIVPTEDGTDDQREIAGIIVAWKDGRTYWEHSFDESGGNTPPDCWSDDMYIGHGKFEGQECAKCSLNQFGSATKGFGKACRESRRMLLVQPDSMLPVVLAAPPTSLKAMKSYFLRLAGRGLNFWKVVTSFTLKTETKGVVHPEIVPRMDYVVPSENVEMARALHQSWDAILKATTIQGDYAVMSDAAEPPE